MHASSISDSEDSLLAVSNSIKCGEITLQLEENWQLIFNCSQCSAMVDNLHSFLQHSLLHFIDNMKYEDIQDKIDYIISQQLIVEDDETKLDCSFSELKTEMKVETAIEHSLNFECYDDDIEEKVNNQDTAGISDELPNEEFELATVSNAQESMKEHITGNETNFVSTLDNNDLNATSLAFVSDDTTEEQLIPPLPVEDATNPIDIRNQCSSYECDICGKRLSCQNALRVHKNRQHLGVKPKICRICGKSTNIKSHAKKCAKIAASQTCDICGKTFLSQTRLQLHRNIHLNIKPFACNMCDMKFAEPGNLSIHKRRIHFRQKTFLCNDCGKAFCTSTELTIHQRCHTKIKPYACTKCSKAYSNSSALAVHLRIHNNERPYKCEVCAKAFPAREHLRRHKIIHTGERPFACSVCDANFTRLTHLRSHMKIHTGVKEYKCLICQRDFAQKCNFKSHMKRVHPEVANVTA